MPTAIERECQYAGILREIGPGRIHPVPDDVWHQAVSARKCVTSKHLMPFTKCNDSLGESEQIGVFFRQIPIQPARGIILTPGIVIALLGPKELIASHQHGYALTDHQCGQKVPNLSLPQGLDHRVVGRPLNSTIP